MDHYYQQTNHLYQVSCFHSEHKMLAYPVCIDIDYLCNSWYRNKNNLNTLQYKCLHFDRDLDHIHFRHKLVSSAYNLTDLDHLPQFHQLQDCFQGLH